MVTEVYTTQQPNTLGDSGAIIEQALKWLKARCKMYDKYECYYIGDQPLTYASEKYSDNFARMVASYSENICPAVVDSLADRLIITTFDSTNEAQLTSVEDIWKKNRMDARAGQVHTEAIKAGDAYVIVWPDDTGFPRIWPQDANGVCVYYDENDEEIEWAAKWWIQDDGKGRLTLYFRDRIERYVTRNKVESTSGFATKATGFVPVDDAAVIPNPYGKVPVFHFANAPRINCWGRSALCDVIPIQDAINKAVADMLVTAEFGAFPQRWATGLMLKNDPNTGKPMNPFEGGIDRLWTSASKDTTFGQFDAASIDALIASKNSFKDAVADVTGTPTHYLRMSPTSWPSGESLKTAEARFVSKITRRQVTFGNVWEDVLVFALTVLGVQTEDTISTVWLDASPRSELEATNIAVLKKTINVPDEQNWRELGYTDEQIDDMKQQKEEQATAALEQQQKLFEAGNQPPPANNAVQGGGN